MNLDHPLMPLALIFIGIPFIGLITALVSIAMGLL